MKITCQSCQSKYTVSDEKVQGKTVKIKCRKCGATIVVNSAGVTNGTAAADAASPSEPPRAAVRRDGGRRGADLFGGGGGMGVQSASDDVQANAPPHFNGSAQAASPSNDRMTGQRDENSVLFSLSALTAKAAP